MKKKMNIVTVVIALVAVLAIGVGIGSTMNTAFADTTTEQANGNLKDAIDRLSGEDVNILLKGMDPALIEQTNLLVGDNNNPKTFIGTYCILDPEFAEIVINYAGN